MVHRRCSRQTHHGGRCVYCSSVNTCQFVYCLSINKCQLVFCLSVYNRHVVPTFAQWHWAVCQISSLHIVYRESLTRKVVYIHVHYGVHCEMYIGIDSHLIDLSLCCIICSQKKKRLGFWLPNQNYWYLVTQTSGSPLCFPADHSVSTPWLENRPNKDNFSWSRLSALMKNRGVGGTL